MSSTQNLSVSEINSYLKCRRAWDITSASRQSLRHKVSPKIYFVIGSAIHEALDAQARGEDPIAALESYVESERSNRRALYEQITGSSAWDSEMEEFESSVCLARGLTRQYFNHYGAENPLQELGLKYVATEIPFSVPLPNGVNFVGTFDGVVTDIATESLFYLIENKTASKKLKPESIQFGNQFVGYNWAFWALTGVTPAGTIVNQIMKNLIQEPRVLKSGALSVDKQARVTLQSFLTALQNGGHDPEKYEDYMTYLHEREVNNDDRFFIREMYTYSQVQLENWYSKTLEPLSEEMCDPRGVNNYLDIYPNRTSCDNCLVSDICNAMDLGEDVEAVKSLRYEVKTYGTMQSVDGARPHVVSSPRELIDYLRGLTHG